MSLKDDAGRQKISIHINHLILTCNQRYQRYYVEIFKMYTQDLLLILNPCFQKKNVQ